MPWSAADIVFTTIYLCTEVVWHPFEGIAQFLTPAVTVLNVAESVYEEVIWNTADVP